ncbi:MAG: amino-acid N-acetyltransferase [Pseudomonadota bacterium]
MQAYIEWFRHSSSYINAHRRKVFVLLLPGEALEHQNFSNIVHDITLLHSLGVRLVLVQGARPQIDAALTAAGLEPRYHDGLRITGAEELQFVKQTVGSLSIDLDAQFSMGLANSPMHGADIRTSRGNYITARPLGVIDGVDFALTGVVRKVDADGIREHLDERSIVLINNVGYSPTGEVFNLSAEDVATEVAVALKADKLILFVPGSGVCNPVGERQSTLNPVAAEALMKELRMTDHQTAEALRAAVAACRKQIQRCQLISYARNGALLEELFTREGSGTLVSNERFEELRQATIDDVGGILELIKPLEERGVLVRRSRDLLEAEIDFFKVIERDGMIIACAAIYPLDETCGEIACIAIHRDYQDNGRGEHLMRALEVEALRLGLSEVIVLTTQTAHWFRERGFVPMEVSELPVARQQMYNFQRNSKAFRKALKTDR